MQLIPLIAKNSRSLNGSHLRTISTLFFVCAICFCSLLTFSQKAVSKSLNQQESQQQLLKLKSNIKKIDHWLSKANSEKTGLSRLLEKQDKEINAISRDIRSQQKEISRQSKTLTTLDAKFKKQNNSLKLQKKQLIKQIRSAYLEGNQSTLKLLLDSENPQDLSRQMKYFSSLSKARNQQIESFQNSLKAIKTTKNKIEIQHRALNKSRIMLETNRRKLEAQQSQRRIVLAKLEAKIKNNSQRLIKMRADQKRLEDLLQELEIAIANIPLPLDASPFKQQKSQLPWPSHGKVMARFGSRLAQNKLKLQGIRISTKENAPVTAIHYGRVIFSNWIRGFGLLIIIDHGDKYMSLYGNNKSLVKEPGDWVRAGEIIAYSSASNKNEESALYFEIRKNGKPQNPLKWLRN